MSSEWTQVSTYNELMTKTVETLDDVILALIESGKSLHGEKTVAAAVLGGESAGVTEFDTGDPDEAVAGSQQVLMDEFTLRLREAGIPYIGISIGEEGRCGILYRDADLDRILEITEDLNLQHARVVRDRDDRSEEEPDQNREEETGMGQTGKKPVQSARSAAGSVRRGRKRADSEKRERT